MSVDHGHVVLGGNVFGWTVGTKEAFSLLDAFVDRGGVSIDTADVYPAWVDGRDGGESEAIIGSWMAERGNRDKMIIATKVAKWERHPGLSPANIRQAVEDSLRRLKTDYIDIYYAHEDDESIEQSVYVEAFDSLVREGKIRQIGASNFSPERLGSAIQLANENGLSGFTVSQDHYNLVERGFEKSLQPVLASHDVVELPYYALAAGFLTGKYRPGIQVDSPRSGAGDYYLGKPYSGALLDRLDELALANNVSVAAISLEWLRAQSVVGAPIASARTIEQLDALFETVSLSHDEVASLSSITT